MVRQTRRMRWYVARLVAALLILIPGLAWGARSSVLGGQPHPVRTPDTMGALIQSTALPAQGPNPTERSNLPKVVLTGRVQTIRSKIVYLEKDGNVVPVDARFIDFHHAVHTGEQVAVVVQEVGRTLQAQAIYGSRQNQSKLLAGAAG